MKQIDYARLMTTPWFDQFNESQQQYIEFGIRDGLNVAHYANPKFMHWQMLQIYRGLKDGVDVTVYANPELNSGVMKGLREGLT